MSNLNAKLRDKARSWLRKLQSEVGITTIFVTHDQCEALALSDRIAVMDRGRIVQIGTPAEIYERPATPFVVDFIGASNFVQGTVIGVREGTASIRPSRWHSCSRTHRHSSRPKQVAAAFRGWQIDRDCSHPNRPCRPGRRDERPHLVTTPNRARHGLRRHVDCYE